MIRRWDISYRRKRRGFVRWDLGPFEKSRTLPTGRILELPATGCCCDEDEDETIMFLWLFNRKGQEGQGDSGRFYDLDIFWVGFGGGPLLGWMLGN